MMGKRPDGMFNFPLSGGLKLHVPDACRSPGLHKDVTVVQTEPPTPQRCDLVASATAVPSSGAAHRHASSSGGGATPSPVPRVAFASSAAARRVRRNSDEGVGLSGWFAESLVALMTGEYPVKDKND